MLLMPRQRYSSFDLISHNILVCSPTEITQDVGFEECLRKTFEECKAMIISAHAHDNSLFGGEPTVEVIQKIPRQADDPGNYFIVALRTNEAGTGVVGTKGDGIVKYPFPWVLPAGTYGDKTYTEPTGIEIGPWDCDTYPLPPDMCCNFIKATMPYPDVNGNLIDCHVSPPLGSESNPVAPNRVVVVTNEDHIVIREPKTG